MNDSIRVNWYRCRMDPGLMSELIRKRQRTDRNYFFVPRLPGHDGDRVGSDRVI
jgi:hypothetical protein